MVKMTNKVEWAKFIFWGLVGVRNMFLIWGGLLALGGVYRYRKCGCISHVECKGLYYCPSESKC